MSLQLSASVLSDIGPLRSGNEDAAFVSPFAAAVADGVGGGPAGEIAASALIHRIAPASNDVTSVGDLRALLQWSNRDLGTRVRQDPSIAGMATTFTGLFLSHAGMFLAHVGDSRAYRLRAGVLTRMTRDDSWVQHLVDSGLISARDALTHPRRNIVTASLHGDPRDGDAITVSRVDALPDDRWLLCSDGISDYLPDDLLADILGDGHSTASASETLVSLALEAGTHDNATVVVCDVVPGRNPRNLRPVFAGAAAEQHLSGDAAIA